MADEITELAITQVSETITDLQRQLAKLVKDNRYRHDQSFKDETDRLDAKRVELCEKLDSITEKAFQVNKEKLQGVLNQIAEVQDKVQLVLSGIGTALQLAEAAEVLAKVVLPFVPII